MGNRFLKQKIIPAIAIIGIVLIILGLAVWIKKTDTNKLNRPADSPKTETTQSTEAPKIVTTKPDPLEDNIVSATEILEITFNRSLENVGEFKSRIEPKIDYKVELSQDRKTAKIIPEKPYDLGTTYTLFIGTETKFDGIGRWGEEKVFHFRTIRYTGV